MRTTLIAVVVGLVLMAGMAWWAYQQGKAAGESTRLDLNRFITAVERGVHAEEKHTGFVWYKVCPERLSGLIRKPPKILMAYPISYAFRSSLSDAQITETAEGGFEVTLPPVKIEGAVANQEHLEFQESGGIFIQDARRYVDAEKERTAHIVRYLAFDELRSNLDAIRRDMAEHIVALGLFAARDARAAAPEIAVRWQEDAQQTYLAQLEQELVPPPFGARGCTPDWFHLNDQTLLFGTLTGEDSPAPAAGPVRFSADAFAPPEDFDERDEISVLGLPATGE